MAALSRAHNRLLERLGLACTLVCLAGLGACSHRTNTELPFRVPPARHVILAFGDSLALGVGASDPARGFMFLLYHAALPRDPGAQITNYAVNGARTEDVLRYELQRAQNEPATDVWICVGGNDVTHATDPARFAAQYEALLHSVRRRWPVARIVVFGVPDVSRSPLFIGPSRAQLHDLAGRDDEAARQAAADVQASFVDLFALGKQVVAARDFAADNFHPNDAGYQAIAHDAQPLVLRSLFQ
jgi:lysophospholipase L1-like esterase